MKLKKLNKEFRTVAKTSAKLEPLVEAAVEHVIETAQVNTPYSIINFYGELCQAELIEMDQRGVQVAALTLQRLIETHGWNSISQWGFFVCGRGESKLREIIDGSTPYGLKFSVDAISRGVAKLAGQEPPANTLRRTLDRLVESGHFIKPKPGLYQRIHRGF